LLPRLLLAASLAGALLLPALPGAAFAPAPLPRKARALTSSIGMKLVLIPKGKFIMGAALDERAGGGERPQHEVEITKPFYLGVYEVTQAEYQKVVGTNPSHFRPGGGGGGFVRGQDTSKFPVETVSWDEAVAFCKKLSDLPAEKRARRVYRLPTEAEWEYACRAGTTTPFAFGASLSSHQANFDGSSPYGAAPRGPSLGRPAAVGSYKPNAWGLFDMHGNVKEWCADWCNDRYYGTSPKADPPGPDRGSSKSIRGGAFINPGHWVRSADRSSYNPSGRLNFVGFRVLCQVAR
jgi:formylglycine-generating enzyme required for sulfatase activity